MLSQSGEKRSIDGEGRERSLRWKNLVGWKGNKKEEGELIQKKKNNLGSFQLDQSFAELGGEKARYEGGSYESVKWKTWEGRAGGREHCEGGHRR